MHIINYRRFLYQIIAHTVIIPPFPCRSCNIAVSNNDTSVKRQIGCLSASGFMRPCSVTVPHIEMIVVRNTDGQSYLSVPGWNGCSLCCLRYDPFRTISASHFRKITHHLLFEIVQSSSRSCIRATQILISFLVEVFESLIIPNKLPGLLFIWVGASSNCCMNMHCISVAIHVVLQLVTILCRHCIS